MKLKSTLLAIGLACAVCLTGCIVIDDDLYYDDYDYEPSHRHHHLADITDTRASVPVDTAVLTAPDPDLVLAVIRECALADMAVPTAADPDLVPGRLQADIPVVDVMTDPAHITAADPDRQEVVTVAITVSAAVLVAVAEPSRVPVVTDMLQA